MIETKEQATRYDRMMEIIEIVKQDWKTNILDVYMKEEVIKKWEEKGLISPFKETIVEVEKPFKTPPEVLKYQKWWREHQKWIKEQGDIEAKNKIKIEQALKRKIVFCFICKKIVECINPTYEIKQGKRLRGEKIIVVCKCPICKNVCRGYAGFLEQKS